MTYWSCRSVSLSLLLPSCMTSCCSASLPHHSVTLQLTAASRCYSPQRLPPHHRSVTLHHRNDHTSKKAWLCFATQPRRCPVSYILTCPPSRALALSAERSKHPARTSHREGRCSPCRSSSLLGSPGIPPCTLLVVVHGTLPSCDIVIMVSATQQLVALARRLTRW